MFPRRLVHSVGMISRDPPLLEELKEFLRQRAPESGVQVQQLREVAEALVEMRLKVRERRRQRHRHHHHRSSNKHGRGGDAGGSGSAEGGRKKVVGGSQA